MNVGHSPAFNDVQTLDQKLDYFRNCSQEDILGLVTNVIPQHRLPLQYLESLSS
jgi:hypothetical protein